MAREDDLSGDSLTAFERDEEAEREEEEEGGEEEEEEDLGASWLTPLAKIFFRGNGSSWRRFGDSAEVARCPTSFRLAGESAEVKPRLWARLGAPRRRARRGGGWRVSPDLALCEMLLGGRAAVRDSHP